MTVAELMAFLENQNPDANVIFVTQPRWPFENSIRTVITRKELMDYKSQKFDELLDEESDDIPDEPFKDGRLLSDVILVEGSQLRYGDRDMWEVVS